MADQPNIKDDKQTIIDLFHTMIKGQTPPASVHDGGRGHWIETQMGLKHNGNNSPDFKGYEMKDHTGSKTTFGDWSPDYALWKKSSLGPARITRSQFLNYFGHPNSEKNNRHSWSGKPCPKIKKYNEYGQILKVTESNDIVAEYSYSQDLRPNKKEIVPIEFQVENLILVKWSCSLLTKRLESKFNQKGWYKFKMKEGKYQELVFGGPINFPTWIEFVKQRKVYFDCGMYEGNSRNYCQWRADNNLWESLIIERYE